MVTGGGPYDLVTVVALTAALAVVAFVAGPANVAGRVFAVLLAVAIVPLVLNQPNGLWFTMLLFASMFVGTVLYRATTGETSGWVAAGVLAFATVLMVVITRLYVAPHAGPVDSFLTYRPEVLTFAAAYLVFGVVLLVRRRVRFPRALTYLGAISYSVYLVHSLVLYAVPWWGADKVLTFTRWTVLTILASAATYHLIEKPSIDLGRRFTGRRRELARQF